MHGPCKPQAPPWCHQKFLGRSSSPTRAPLHLMSALLLDDTDFSSLSKEPPAACQTQHCPPGAWEQYLGAQGHFPVSGVRGGRQAFLLAGRWLLQAISKQELRLK